MQIPLSNHRLTQTHYKLLTLAGLGGALEFLDFTIYALFARYFSQNFFPSSDKLSSLLSTFAVFALGYFARPLGGIVFGHFGDKYGRKNAFTASAFVMALSTLLMGCLPTYHSIGIAAPLLLVILRLFQGISVGGEVPGATVFISEHFPDHKKGLAVGLIFMGVTLGNVIGSGLGYLLTRQLSLESMFQWGWRIPFIAGFILGLVAYFLRKKALETPLFLTLIQAKSIYRFPSLAVIKNAWPSLLISISLIALPAGTLFIFLYLPSYPPIQKYYPANDIYFINSISFLLLALLTGFFGILSDYWGRKKLILLGSSLSIVASYFLFTFLLKKDISELLFFCLGMASLTAIVNGCYGCVIAELFPTKIRYSGMGISYNIGVALFGGMAIFIITALLKLTQSYLVLYYFFSICAFITLMGALFIKKSRASLEALDD